MIITRTPYRVSLIGGGSDYPQWYRKYGGETISFTIDKYLYISLRKLEKFFNHSIRISYSSLEEVNSFNKIQHPSVRETLKYFNLKNIEIHYDGDLPARVGMGSSSAFTVGLILAISKYNNKKVSKEKLASQAIFIEQNLVKEIVGSQDQVIASYGGIRNTIFNKNGKIISKVLKISKKTKKKLENNLFLIFTGITREAQKVASTYVNNIEDKKKLIEKNQELLKKMKKSLLSNKLNDIGIILNESWILKKKFSNKVSNNFIDKLYNKGIKSGATGGKLLGAGGGGFILFYVPKKNHKSFLKKFNKDVVISLKIENKGSTAIYSND